jgi:hypothetical protein
VPGQLTPSIGATPPPAPLLPSMNTPGPISIAFKHSPNRSQGSAHVISMPPGIDCPPTCAASFGQGVDVTIEATADSNSVLEVINCYAWTAGPTTQRLPGNTLACGWPGLAAARGGPTFVYVNGAESSAQPGATGGTSPPGPSSGSGTPGSGSGGVGGGASGGSVGASVVQYVSPLPSTCIKSFWDPQFYNWLSYENDCSQPIYLEFIFNHATGWAMTGSMNLAPGAHANTGRSNSDINQAGGMEFYVCPVGSLPVDLNGQLLQSNVSEFKCKVQ